MAYAVPTNFAAGAVLTEAQLDVLGNDIVFLANPPKVRVYSSTAVSVATGTTTPVMFDSERFDTDTMHSTSVNTSRITFTTAGSYLVGGGLQYAANTTGIRDAKIRLNGSTYIAYNRAQAVSAAGPLVTNLTVSTLYAFSAGDYIELVAEQTSGGALNVEAGGNYSPEFWAIWMSL